jgi:hypothetical protein
LASKAFTLSPVDGHAFTVYQFLGIMQSALLFAQAISRKVYNAYLNGEKVAVEKAPKRYTGTSE